MSRVLFCVVCLLAVYASSAAQGQARTVLAEAINQANLRAGPGTNFSTVGTINKGTKYPVVGRSARFPWVLIELPTGHGWVFKDLVTITGNLDSVPVTEQTVEVGATGTGAATGAASGAATGAATLAATLSGQPAVATVQISDPGQSTVAVTASNPLEATAITISATPTRPPTRVALVYAEPKNEDTNVRYGPGTDFPIIGKVQKGQLYAVLRRHARFDKWIEIAFAEVASGRAWIHVDVVNLSGPLNVVPVTSETNFGYPTLTPTKAMVVTATPLAGTAAGTPGAASNPGAPKVSLEALGNAIYTSLMAQNYVPRSKMQGSVFMMDLQSRQSVVLNPGVAYSGASLMKIPVLVAFYRKTKGAPTADEARLMAEMILCSENLSSNKLLTIIGDGDEYRGALYVTDTLRALGIKNTFLIRSFFTGAKALGPTPTEQPFVPIKSEADQTSAEPDPSNQMTPADMGSLLASIHECAMDGSGILPTTFPEALTLNNCRRILRVLRANRINAMIEAGVGANTIVAHKHAWLDNTHADGGLVYSPGGDYVLVIVLQNNGATLEYAKSFPVIAEISRLVYNAYNPAQAIDKTNTQPVPLCSIDTINALDPALLKDLQAPSLPFIR